MRSLLGLTSFALLGFAVLAPASLVLGTGSAALAQAAPSPEQAHVHADAAPGPLLRYRLALRTSGDYAQIRAFLGRTLEQLHFVALDDVQFRRGADAAAPLDADVRLSLYLRRP